MSNRGKETHKLREVTRKPRGAPEIQPGPAEELFRKNYIAMSDATSRLSVDEATILSVVVDLSRLPEHKTHIWFSEHLVLESPTLRASTSRASGKVLNATIWFFVTVKGVKSRLPITCAIPLNQVPEPEVRTGDESLILVRVETWLAQQCERVAIERYPEIVPARCDDEGEYEFWKGEPEHDSIPVELVPNNDIIDFLIEGAAKNIDYWKALGKVAKLLKASDRPLDGPLKRRLEAAIDPANRPSGRTPAEVCTPKRPELWHCGSPEEFRAAGSIYMGS